MGVKYWLTTWRVMRVYRKTCRRGEHRPIIGIGKCWCESVDLEALSR